MRRSFFAAVLGAAVSLGPSSAAAQTDPSAVAVALFQQGRDLVKQGRYAEACPKLAESQRLEPKVGTLLNLALCNEKLGKLATAWAEYGSAATMARREGPGEAEREAFARDQLAALEKRLSHVTLHASAPEPGLRLTLDDQPLAEAVVGVPLPIDPGKHRLSAIATGKKAWSTEVDVTGEKQDFHVSIPALEAASAAPPVPPPPTAGPIAPPAPTASVPPPVVQPPQPASGPSTATILMGAGFGVGGAGVLIGAITGAVTLANAGTIRGHCNSSNVCTSDQQSAIDSANTLANVSNVSFGLGAAGIVVGVVGVLMRPGSPAPAAAPAARLRVTPIVGPGVVGLRGSF